MAPEYFVDKPKCTAELDIFSLGITVMEILVGNRHSAVEDVSVIYLSALK